MKNMFPCVSIRNGADASVRLRTGTVSLQTVNVRGLTSRFSELSAYIGTMKIRVTFIVITETWLRNDSECAFELVGYKSLSIYV